MFDIFYIGKAPGLFTHEKSARDIEHAREQCTTRYFWIVNYLSDYSEVDFLWEPPPWEGQYRHAWPSQHQKDSGTYLVPARGYTETKYRNEWRIYRTSCYDNWDTIVDNWDYSWHPDPGEPAYRYQFGTQYQKTGGPVYTVPGASETKYINCLIWQKNTVDEHWVIPTGLTIKDFDLCWHPDHSEPPYIYKFGTQHQRTGGPEYHVPGATKIKYMPDYQVQKYSVDPYWSTPDGLADGFDYTWHPDSDEIPYIYQFGTQHQKTGGPTYTVPGAIDIKYIDVQHATKISIDDYWDNPDNMELDRFDYTWHPDDTEPAYIYQFGTQWQKTGGPVYRMAGATTTKYPATPRYLRTTIDSNWEIPADMNRDNFDWTWHPDATDPPMTYQFGTQWQKTGGPVYKVAGAEKTKYQSLPRYIKDAVDDNWIIPDNVVVENFDYTWHPDATDPDYNYQFGTQHQKTGGPLYAIPGSASTKYVQQQDATVGKVANGVIIIDHMDGNTINYLPDLPVLKRTRYVDNYKDTLKRVICNLEDSIDFVWVLSTVCDYKDFDFSWHPEQWQATMLQVFPSDDQKFGDTFFVHVPTFKDRIDDAELLEWFNCNYQDTVVPRQPLTVVEYNQDTLLDAVKAADLRAPLTLFTRYAINDIEVPAVNLWRPKTKNITCLNQDNSTAIVPREAKTFAEKQLYDYPYIDRTTQDVVPTVPQDIVYISYDESEAEQNWEKIVHRFPRTKRVHGVEGMENALIQAAKKSETPWYYAVFAKTALAESFEFDFVPDFLQIPKHYIFNCRNRVNSLEYGHMGIILYNCNMVINGASYDKLGLDYTLSFPTESIPLLSCHGNFDTTPYQTWRTSFREVAKLAYFESVKPTVENGYRLDVWQNKAEGEHAEWAINGARDGVEFFEESGGDLAHMKQSFRWEWLRERFVKKYGDRV
jgi:hypothetical protein